MPALVEPAVVDRHDVRVLERLGVLGLAEEPLEQGRVLGQRPGQDLDGDLVPRLHVDGAEDRAHPARPEGLDQAVAARASGRALGRLVGSGSGMRHRSRGRAPRFAEATFDLFYAAGGSLTTIRRKIGGRGEPVMSAVVAVGMAVCKRGAEESRSERRRGRRIPLSARSARPDVPLSPDPADPHSSLRAPPASDHDRPLTRRRPIGRESGPHRRHRARSSGG